MSDHGKETITVLELDMPFCQKEYGTTNAFGTCAASLTPVGSPPLPTGTRKCFNTRVTCQDPVNYLPATQIIRFSHPVRGLSKYYDNVFPSMTIGDNPKTTPGIINLGGMDQNVSALGAREIVDIDFEDHQWNDHLFDKYRLQRISGAAQAPTGSPPISETYNPKDRGTFWGKFLARNPYYSSYRARVKCGFMGDPLASMRTRHYIVDRITGPTNGKVRVTLKDLFSLIEAKKSVAPVASLGQLAADLTSTATTATLAPTGIGNLDYPTSGYVVIGDEVIKFTRSGDTLTFLDGSPPISTRGSLGTTASEHDQEDLVQIVLVLPTDQAHDHIYNLLTQFSGISAAEIEKSKWDILAASMPELYSTFVVEPTPVQDLIGELCEQSGCTVWHDPSTGFIEFRPLRPQTASVTVTDREWVIDRSLDIKRQDSKRVSDVHVYYGQRNPTLALDEPTNFRSRIIAEESDASGPQQYGVPILREIFSRWIPQFGSTQAAATADRIIAMFRDPPLEANFKLHGSRDGKLFLARAFNLKVFETQDDTGLEIPQLMAPVQYHRNEKEIKVRAQGIKFFTAPADVANERIINLDSQDMRNLNMRTIHDSVYAAPTGDETVTFILPDGFSVGSADATLPSLRTGTWPTGVALSFINKSRVQGKGGNAGAGGSLGGAGGNGQTGGTALLAEYFITVNNTDGELWAGGGGGGGGGSGMEPATLFAAGGGGGGGGTGLDFGLGALPGLNNGTTIQSPVGGSTSTDLVGGAGGVGGVVFGVGSRAVNRPSGGKGGAGGGIAEKGFNGDAGFSNIGFAQINGAGGLGGAAGKYVEGNAFITWAGNGDRRGGVS